MSLNQRLVLMACLAVLPGCATQGHGTPANESNARASQEDVVDAQAGETRLRVGQVLAIELASNASTGYGWEVIDDGSPQLVPAPVPARTEVSPPPMPGAGGTSRWRYRAAQVGTTTLRLVYRRPWEKDVAPASTARYRVVVE